MTFRLTSFHTVKRTGGTNTRNGRQMPEEEVASWALELNQEIDSAFSTVRV